MHTDHAAYPVNIPSNVENQPGLSWFKSMKWALINLNLGSKLSPNQTKLQNIFEYLYYNNVTSIDLLFMTQNLDSLLEVTDMFRKYR